jgi:hypothetical protein
MDQVLYVCDALLQKPCWKLRGSPHVQMQLIQETSVLYGLEATKLTILQG